MNERIVREMTTAAGPVPVVSTRLSGADVRGAIRVRWGIGRTGYAVDPGVYAVGDPSADSPVLVTANYRLTFDILRKELDGLDAWVLVLDTRGINVWCAAGKGTFGTEELVRRIAATRLAEIVRHRRLVLPQLGATGVSAHEVTRLSGFRVTYGPVRAADIRAFLEAGCRKTEEMRRVRFDAADRLALVPIEVTHGLPWVLAILIAVVAVRLASGAGFSVGSVFAGFLPFLGAFLAGAVAVPLLLPYIPVRPFAAKGAVAGLVWATVVILAVRPRVAGSVAYLLLLPAIAAFVAMSFTGSSTFTSLAGVKVEVRIATPAIIVSAAVGVVLLALELFGVL